MNGHDSRRLIPEGLKAIVRFAEQRAAAPVGAVRLPDQAYSRE